MRISIKPEQAKKLQAVLRICKFLGNISCEHESEPYGFEDYFPDMLHVGCEVLRKRLDEFFKLYDGKEECDESNR